MCVFAKCIKYGARTKSFNFQVENKLLVLVKELTTIQVYILKYWMHHFQHNSPLLKRVIGILNKWIFSTAKSSFVCEKRPVINTLAYYLLDKFCCCCWVVKKCIILHSSGIVANIIIYLVKYLVEASAEEDASLGFPWESVTKKTKARRGFWLNCFCTFVAH